ncbi:MAG: hypothetical protein PHW73_04840 [Atribacterota bacterium]|nr:hypothetical protein [Atribacterota bacterium]
MPKETLDSKLWGEKPEELKPLLRFTEANNFTLEVTITANRAGIPLSSMEGDFGLSIMATFPEGMLNVTSKRLRAVINKEFIGVDHKVKIVRSGEGFNTQYAIIRMKEEKPTKKPKTTE